MPSRPSQRSVLIAAGQSLLFTLIIANSALAQGVVGSVTALESNATLVRNGQQLKVIPAMALQTNDKLITERDAIS